MYMYIQAVWFCWTFGEHCKLLIWQCNTHTTTETFQSSTVQGQQLSRLRMQKVHMQNNSKGKAGWKTGYDPCTGGGTDLHNFRGRTDDEEALNRCVHSFILGKVLSLLYMLQSNLFTAFSSVVNMDWIYCTHTHKRTLAAINVNMQICNIHWGV